MINLKFRFSNYRFLFISLLFILSVCLTACSKKEQGEPLQFQEGSGQHVARIYIKDYGSFDLRLFEDKAPDTVISFIELAASGFYDDKPIYSIIEDYCLLMGESNVQSVSSKDTDKLFKNADNELLPFTGSLCVLNDGSGAGAEHFMIVTADSDFLYELKELLAYKMITPQEYFKTAYGKSIDDEALELYYRYGGAPWLSGDCIVFGQIYEGMDVINSICLAEVSDDSSYSPLETITIDHIEVK